MTLAWGDVVRLLLAPVLAIVALPLRIMLALVTFFATLAVYGMILGWMTNTRMGIGDALLALALAVLAACATWARRRIP